MILELSLSQALAVNSSLTNLDLRGNSIGDSGATDLSHVSTVNTTVHLNTTVHGVPVYDEEEEEEQGDKDKEKHINW